MEADSPDYQDVFSPVPDVATGSSSALFTLMLPKVSDQGDLARFHAIDAWMKNQAEQRKAQNAKLIEIEKAWDTRKALLKPDLEILALRGEGGTMLGTTYLRDRDDAVSWTSDAEIIAAATELGLALEEEHVVYEPRLTEEGRRYLKDTLIARAKAGMDVPACATFTPGGKSVCTRLKGRQMIDPRKLLALRNDAMRSLAIPSNQDSQDSDESHD